MTPFNGRHPDPTLGGERRMWGRGLIVVPTVLLVVGMLVGPSSAQPALELSPPSGPAGSDVTAEGCGWPVDTTVEVTGEDGSLLGDASTGRDDCFSTTITIPSSAEPPSYAVTASADEESVTARFTVEEGSGSEHPTDPRWPGLQRLKQDTADEVDARFVEGFPEIVETRVQVSGATSVKRALSFVQTYPELYGQDTSDRLALTPTRVTASEAFHHVTLQQTVDGVEVFGGQLTVLANGDEVVTTLGRLLADEPAVGTTPQLSEAEAVDAAEEALGSPSGTTVLAPPTLTVFSPFVVGLDNEDDRGPALAWRVGVNTDEGASGVLVDASTGDPLYRHSLTQGGFDLDLEDGNYHTAAGDCFQLSGTDQAAVAAGVLSSYANDADVVAGWHLSHDLYNYFMHHFGRDSWDNNGDDFDVFVHTTDSGTASWWGSCGLWSFNDNAVVDDVFAHEYTHAVISDTSELIYANQSGAINESFSDIFGALLDTDDWLMGEDLPQGTVRDMQDPAAQGDPAHMSNKLPDVSDPQPGTNPGNDNGWVHSNSGIMNRAAFLMAEGDTDGNGIPDGIGRGGLRSLAYTVMISLPESATFAQARWAFVSTAAGWATNNTAGFTPTDACQVRNAWSMVGLGAGDQDCDGTLDHVDPDVDGDGVADTDDNCESTPNPSQADSDGDGEGDACDDDADNDGIANADDNCTQVPNADQADSNNNDVGDACEDRDGDHVVDGVDNCVDAFNPSQNDADGDGLGDACDDDADDDGVPNISDNCPLVPNPDQTDTDGGGLGDACDIWPDNPVNDVILSRGDTVHDFRVQPGAIEHILIDLCAAGCPEDWLNIGSQMQLSIEGLPADTTAMINTLDGSHVAQFEVEPATAFQQGAARTQQTEDTAGPRTARFTPKGLGTFVVTIATHPDAPETMVDLTLTGDVRPRPAVIDRLSGPNRFATGAAVSRRNFPVGADTVYVATGEQFPDALAAVPAAGVDSAPILLTSHGAVPQETAAELERLDAERVVILGGEAAVSAEVADELTDAGHAVVRRAGSDRFATAAATATAAYPDGVGTALLATGEGFPDALAGGAAAALDAPMLLTARNDLPDTTRDALGTLGVNEVLVLGGTAAIADDVVDELLAAGVDVTRLAGPDRYATAATIVDHAFPDSADIALIATGETFADALAGGAAAAALDAPMLLSSTAQLPDVTATRLPQGPHARVLLLGGTAALSAHVADQVTAAANS